VTASRIPVILASAALTVAAATAAVLLNLVLLGSAAAGSDPVGQLKPRANLPAAPHWTIRPTRGPIEDRHADD
jgi:hypothetical protein